MASFAKTRERDLKGKFIKLTKPSGFDKVKYLKKYNELHKEERTKKSVEWGRKNKERRKIIKARWIVKNRERMKYYSKLRHYRHKNAEGLHSFEDIKELFVKFNKNCAYCIFREADSIDHIIPLTKGGTNNIDNLLPVCISCNSSKGDKILLEWRPITALTLNKIYRGVSVESGKQRHSEMMAQIKKDFPIW